MDNNQLNINNQTNQDLDEFWEPNNDLLEWLNEEENNNNIVKNTELITTPDGGYKEIEYLDQDYLLIEKEKAKFVRIRSYNNEGNLIERKVETINNDKNIEQEIIYIPNTYDIKKINTFQLNKDEFIKLQIKYRNDFEKLLKKIINFSVIEEKIKAEIPKFPEVYDCDYNFYHKYSTLPQGIYLRNNIHIERLTSEEIKKIYENIDINKELDENFFTQTIARVLFENGEMTFFGLPITQKKAPSKSIILEFAYDLRKCKTIEEIAKIKRVFEEIKKLIESQDLLPITLLEEDSLEDIFNSSYYEEDEYDEQDEIKTY